MDKAERAKQFMAFSPLRGYQDMIAKKQKILVEKKDLTEDSAEELSFKINQIKVGEIVSVTYFCIDEYVKCTGMVSKLDFTSKSITIVKTKIPFDSIVSVDGQNIKDLDE